MRNKRNILPCLIFLLTSMFCYSVQAQQKNDNHRTNFSGEWKSKESISMGGNIVCSYVEGDRMNSKTMKIAEQADFLTIENPNPDAGAVSAINREKLAFNGKESEIKHDQGLRKNFTVKLSIDGQTMTINTIVQIMYTINGQKEAFVYVTEVWKLSDDGKTITIQAKAKSDILGDERNWKTLFYKTN